MAIIQSVHTPFGIDIPNAYIKIVFFAGDKSYVQYHTRTYASAEARLADKAYFAETNYSLPYAEGMGDILIACYQHLKSQPGFEAAVDAL